MSSSQGYSDRLTPYENKGELNLQHDPGNALAVLFQAKYIARRIRGAQHVVVHTGAGISTNSGIPDFRGPNGVWTVQERGQHEDVEHKAKRRRLSRDSSDVEQLDRKPVVSFENAMPSLTHAVITAMQRENLVHYVVSQNIDNLHLKSGLPREALSELHGNLFVDWCAYCPKEIQRDSEAISVGLRPTGRMCPNCSGVLTDKALDWEDELPEPDFQRAQTHSGRADLQLVIGTSCQMDPARNLPFRNKHGKQSRILVNLSETPFDYRFGTVVRYDCDTVLAIIANELCLSVPDITRVARLKLCASRASHGVDFSVRQLWDENWALRKVYGVVGIQYGKEVDGDVPKTAWRNLQSDAGYNDTIDTCNTIGIKVFVDGISTTLFKNVPVSPPPGSSIEMLVTTGKIRCSDLINTLMRTLKKEAYVSGREDHLNEDVVNQFFVSGANRRGSSTCVLCQETVWSGKGIRGRHIAKCRSRALKKCD